MNEEMLHAYLDGELTAAEIEQVERALASDANWASEYATLVAVDASIGELPGLPVSDGLLADGVLADDLLVDDGGAFVRECIAGSRSSGPGRASPAGRLLRLVGPLVAAAAALALVVVSENGPQSEDPAISPMVFSVDDQVQYLYWEADSDTFGSGDLQSLENEILAALESS